LGPSLTAEEIAELEAAFDELRRDALAIAGWAIPGMGLLSSSLPVARLDASARLDVFDLWRVIRLDGGLHAEVRWLLPRREGEGQGSHLLKVKVLTPARCTFAVVFRLPEHRPLLDAVVKTKTLGLTVEPLLLDAEVWRVSFPDLEQISELPTLAEGR